MAKRKVIIEDLEDEDEEDEVVEIASDGSAKSKFIFLLLILAVAFSAYTFYSTPMDKKQGASLSKDLENIKEIEYAPQVRKLEVTKKADEAYKKAAGFKDTTTYVVEYGEGLPKTRNR